jgi:hypothetical protein
MIFAMKATFPLVAAMTIALSAVACAAHEDGVCCAAARNFGSLPQTAKTARKIAGGARDFWLGAGDGLRGEFPATFRSPGRETFTFMPSTTTSDSAEPPQLSIVTSAPTGAG